MAEISDVKSVTFERFYISADAESMIFEVRSPAGTVGHISIEWSNLMTTKQLMERAAEKCAEARKTLGKSNLYEGKGLTAQLVSGFQVSEIPANHLKVLSLQSPVGFRCDFAIPTNKPDQRGRSMDRAIAEELLLDQNAEARRPH